MFVLGATARWQQRTSVSEKLSQVQIERVSRHKMGTFKHILHVIRTVPICVLF